jgi:hypothetical protein
VGQDRADFYQAFFGGLKCLKLQQKVFKCLDRGGDKMKINVQELKGKSVEEIEQILTEKLTPEERAIIENWQIIECLNGRR